MTTGTPPGRPLIAVLGEALIDFVENGDDEPRLARPGGSPYNVAIGLARLDRHAAYVGRFSRDPLGSVLLRHAQRSDVDLTLCVDAFEPSTIALVELADGVARYRFGVDGTADFRFTDAELARIPETADLLHFGSLTSWTPPGDAAVVRRVTQLREHMMVTYDPNVRPLLQTDLTLARRQVETAIGLAHLVKTSEEDLDYLYPDEDPEAVAQRWVGAGPGLVIVTRGADGASAYTAQRSAHRPIRPVAMIDTIGAGDAFMSGLLDALIGHGLLSDVAGLAELDEAMLGRLVEQAILVAAVTCTRAGANPPRRADLAVPSPWGHSARS